MNIYSNIYYVYAYLRASDNTPYYIGKGKGKRHLHKHKVSVPKDTSKIVFLEKNLTNIGACALERRYIRWYGRKDLGTGILHNKTDGGEGQPGAIRSAEWRKNHSEKLTGKKLSDEHVKKIKNYDRSYMKSEEYRATISRVKKGKPSKTKGRRGFVPKSMKVVTPNGTFLSLREASDTLKVSLYYVTKWAKNNENGYSLCV
jgi:hypothetical protein